MVRWRRARGSVLAGWPSNAATSWSRRHPRLNQASYINATSETRHTHVLRQAIIVGRSMHHVGNMRCNHDTSTGRLASTPQLEAFDASYLCLQTFEMGIYRRRMNRHSACMSPLILYFEALALRRAGIRGRHQLNDLRVHVIDAVHAIVRRASTSSGGIQDRARCV